jgi:hypothetical protein
LNAEGAQRYERALTVSAESGEPVGAYMRSVTVGGFRGIGPTAMLEIGPWPGLTLVVGRNGSGKSSLAETLEVLLTGTLIRRALPAPAVVRVDWRSKHAVRDSDIRAEFFIEDSGNATIRRSWGANADLGGSTAWLQADKGKRAPLSALG